MFEVHYSIADRNFVIRHRSPKVACDRAMEAIRWHWIFNGEANFCIEMKQYGKSLMSIQKSKYFISYEGSISDRLYQWSNYPYIMP